MLLRKRQQVFVSRCIEALKAHGNTLAVGPCGSGKTLMLSAVAGELLTESDAKACILAHRDELTEQNRTKFERVNPGITTSVFDANEKSWNGQATFAMVQTLTRDRHLEAMPAVDLMVIDECVPAGTLVDGYAIETIRVGDRVTAYDHHERVTITRTVTRTFRNRPGRLVQIRVAGNTDLVCTPAHPIFNPEIQDYVPAIELIVGQEVLCLEDNSESDLHLVRPGNGNHPKTSAPDIPENRKGLLFGCLPGCESPGDQQQDYGTDKSSLCLGTNDCKQSDVSPRKPRKDADQAAHDQTPASRPGRQWPSDSGTSATVEIHARRRLGNGAHSAHEASPDGISQSLQARYRASHTEDCDRNRRRVSPVDQDKGERQKEGALSPTKRVVSVAILEPGSDGRFGGLCPDGFVYNLEVAETHNYFANGVLVHNCHHAAAPSYRRVVDRVLAKNPRTRIYGVTATAIRGDGKGLREVFTNVADQITLAELVASGHLVPPRTFVVDVGAQDALKHVRRLASDFDMTEVESILNKTPINEAVVRHWRDKAGDRKTIVFCSTVAHAESVQRAFAEAGIGAVLIHGDLSEGERKARLHDYESGPAQVVVNVAVLTEGYDYTPTACVVLLRPSSHKSTLTQMIGRGLRVVDPNEHPGVVKTDCIVLDFGTATLMHGSLEQEADLDGHEPHGPMPTKDCPQCQAIVPLGCRECPLCGFEWTYETADDHEPLGDFVMTEIDLLKRSNFRWCDLFGQDDALIATGFDAWGGVFTLDGRWHAVGGGKDLTPHLIAVGHRTVCLAAADDWLNDHETLEAAHKTRRWLNEPPTEKQLRYLPPAMRADYGLTRYQASCLLSFQFNKGAIRRLVFGAREGRREAA